MSQINTNGINVNYPVPGVNNNSQGFRDNFAAIRTNLNTASTEITNLQTNVVVKAALANTVVDNNMANTLISNALTRSFRASTYNLGNNISNTVVVNTSLGDVQYGTISGNTTIQFAGWAPSGTQSNVQLQLNISNAEAVISFPTQVSMTGTYGVETLENFANVGNVPTVTIPYGVTQLEYRLSTIDCGNNITIEPFNRPRITTQVQQRTPTSTGEQGDVAGDVAVDTNYVYVCTGSYDSSTSIWKSISLVGASGANQTISGSLTIGGLLAVSSNDSITATGTVQTNATLLTDNINIVTSVPSNSGVILPIAVAGYRIIVRNNSTNTLKVYPNTGADINSGAINTAVTLTASASTEYFCSTSAVANAGGHWYTLNSAYA